MSTPGENKADPFVSYRIALEKITAHISNKEYSSRPCVFISHKSEDAEACEPIAQYIMMAGVDVYFAKHDKTLATLLQEGDPDKITERIQRGIDLSTHMLCVVSVLTVGSYWVPFEVGYGCKKIPLGILTLKGIAEPSLPEYMRTTNVIRGTQSLNDLISRLLGQPEESLTEKSLLKKHYDRRHPLDAVLDWNK